LIRATVVRPQACIPAPMQTRVPVPRAAMKPLRLVSTPTRNRRLNEIIGLVVLACAALLLLALATYTPTDPPRTRWADSPRARIPAPAWAAVSALNSTGRHITGPAWSAHGWPIWSSRPSASPRSCCRSCWAGLAGAGCGSARPARPWRASSAWPVDRLRAAAIGLLPHTFYWRQALPLRVLLAACWPTPWCIISTCPARPSCSLDGGNVALPGHHLHFHTASEWMDRHFSIVRRISERIQEWKVRRAAAREEKRAMREQETAAEILAAPLPAAANRISSRPDWRSNASVRPIPAPMPLHAAGSLFGWWGKLRRKRTLPVAPQDAVANSPRNLPFRCGNPCRAPTSTPPTDAAGHRRRRCCAIR